MRKLICTTLILAALSASRAENWYIDPDGCPDPNGSMESPFATIQEALNAAQSGDTLILNPGIYTGPGNYNINPGGLLLTIQSTNPEDFDVISETIIDPNFSGHAFIFQNNEDPNFLLYGLTFRNTWTDQEDDPPHGSAVFCSESSPTIRFCVFQNCDADGGWGGAFYGQFSRSRFEHCLFFGNKARYGGALAVNLESQIHIDHCTIAGNQAFFNGGGLLCAFDSSVTINHSLVFFNRLEITENKGHQISVRNSSCTASYSCISDEPNDLEVYSDALLLYESGIIHTDPAFVFYEPAAPPAQMDFHLKSRYGRWDRFSRFWTEDSITSACIDAGDPNSPAWTAELWPNGKRVNIGFYGGTDQASMFGNPADFNLSGKVDLSDFSELAETWLNDSFLDIHDLNRDSRIDLLDFELFSRHWLWKEKSSADFDADGDVDADDLICLSDQWLQGGYPYPEDLDQDGLINLRDFSLFSREWLWKQ